jgi:hypothetical protein
MIVNESTMSSAKVVRLMVGVAPQARPSIREPRFGMRNSTREIVAMNRISLGIELKFFAG